MPQQKTPSQKRTVDKKVESSISQVRGLQGEGRGSWRNFKILLIALFVIGFVSAAVWITQRGDQSTGSGAQVDIVYNTAQITYSSTDGTFSETLDSNTVETDVQ